MDHREPRLAAAFRGQNHPRTPGISLAPRSRTLMVCASRRTVSVAAAVAGMALLLGGRVLTARQDPATASAPKVIEVVAKRFAFEPSQIEVTEGDHVRLMVSSADGVHGVAIKKFKVNKPVPRGGKPVAIEFVASTPGTYEILCSEYCGEGHDDMRGTLVVQAKPKTR
jgi:cytochrome c oxidase subunit 2